MSNNFKFLLSSAGRNQFERIMEIAFTVHARATHYYTNKNILVFCWTDCVSPLHEVSKLLYPMEVKDATNFAWGWLKGADLGPEPDHDGDNVAGFTVYNENWGYVDHLWQAFVAIQPTWMMYGK